MKAIVRGFGYRDMVMNLDDAVVFIQLAGKAEKFREKYHRAVEETPLTKGKASYTTKHVWTAIDDMSGITLRLMSDDEYRAAKLLGEPADD